MLELHALRRAPAAANLFRVFSHRGVLGDVDTNATERLVTYFFTLGSAHVRNLYAHAIDMFS